MKIAAVICEYNPLHLGHVRQLAATRTALGEQAALLCLMSGNFVQRGEPAVFDKWLRAQAAVACGADLVLELPITSALGSAGHFAGGAVAVLDALGAVDVLSFGSECGDLSRLQTAADLLGTPPFEAALRRQLETGISFAAARQRALESLGGDGALLASPNNGLALDYLLALRAYGSAIRPMTVPRLGDLPAAADLRGLIPGGPWRKSVPEAAAVRFSQALDAGLAPYRLEHGEKAMLAVLRTLPDAAFSALPFGGEGLWSKVMKLCRREPSLDGILAGAKSKRYAYARLKRMLLWAFLGLTPQTPPYVRVLAFNPQGREVLHRLKQTTKLPLASGKPPRTPEARAYLELETRATDLYGLFLPQGSPAQWGREKWERVRILPA